jgi:phage terminase large subunit
MAREIVIPYQPREVFVDYHKDKRRNALTVAHRRAGKTVARVNKLIRKACESTLDNPRFGYLAPFYVQAKDIAWLYLKNYTAPIIQGVGGKVNEGELSITLGHNNAVIRLYGAENAERMRGVYFDGIVIDEAQGIAKSVLTQIILPCLADRLGWLDCSGTPKGRSNLLGELLEIARNNPSKWYLQVLKASETGLIDAGELESLKLMMPENEYLQEFECDFDAAITGAFYGKEMTELDKTGRITPIEYNKDFAVFTAWDLGYSDDTAIWWYQCFGGEIHVLDYYSDNGKTIEHYADLVKNKPYKYGKHWLPHDAKAKTLASGGKSIIEMLVNALGMGNVSIVPDLSVQDGIQAARVALQRTWIDPKCKDGIDCLRQYQREFDEDKKVFRDKPRHDWTSHGADAFRMLAIAYQEEFKPPPLEEKLKAISVGESGVLNVSLNELWTTQGDRSGRL